VLEYLPTPHLKEDLPATFYDGIRKKSETTFDNVKGRRNCVALDLSFRQPAADPQAAQNFAVPALSGSGGALSAFERAYSTGYAVLTSTGCVQSSDFPRSTGHQSVEATSHYIDSD
jgi:hypothetical protein